MSLLCKNVTLISAFWEWHQTLVRTTLLRQISFLVEGPLSEKGRKMLIGLLAKRWSPKSPKLVYTARYAERKPGLNKNQGCWCCITLYYPLISMYNQKYKKLSRTIKDGTVSQTSFSNWFLGNLAPPVSTLSLSLSPSPSLSFSGWPLGTLSPRRDTLCYSNGCRWPT